MGKKKAHIFLITLAIIFALGFLYFIVPKSKFDISNAGIVESCPRISPDYSGCIIPSNIAPLHFRIEEKGKRYLVEIFSESGDKIKIISKNPSVSIPMKKWHALLSVNKGNTLYFNVYTEGRNGKVTQYQPLANQIAHEDIDGYLVYRLIYPVYILWDKIGIYQRDISTFEETPVLVNTLLDNSCINCHAFHNHNPDRMLIHTRLGYGTGMLLTHNDKVERIHTKTGFNDHAAYRSWHPGGKLIAFSSNSVRQFFRAIGENRDVFDKASDLVVYNIESNTITTCPEIADPEMMETFPEWSADGEALYFCSAPRNEGLESRVIDTSVYKTVKYNLMRIGFNPETEEWGKPDTVLSSSETGLSIAHPKVSPDGRFLMFCMASYGNFTIYNPTSNLYIMDLQSGTYYKPDINSDRSESYHSWSSNSRWVVFSSKRTDGLCARPYICYVDTQGIASKPFVLPQKTPDFYSSFLMTYNVPEFVTSKITTDPRMLAKTLKKADAAKQALLDTAIHVLPSTTEEIQQMWKPKM